MREFNLKTLPEDWSSKNRHGARVGEKFDPIRRVGLYVPGGQVPLVSTVLMTATLARIAGCPEIAAFTPSGPGGRIAPDLLAALQLAGVEEVYRIGGVQAIGAMAYGTRTIPAVDKIFGPGNAYVCEAKRQVFGTVGVDLLPGPSEVMVIADGGARPEFAAADLLAQAEHGSGREKIYLVATSPGVVRAIGSEMGRQARGASRASRRRRGSWRSGFLCDRRSHASAQRRDVANQVAPEPLWSSLSARRMFPALVRGDHHRGRHHDRQSTPPTALGDFAAGPSHVLPTGRAGRFFERAAGRRSSCGARASFATTARSVRRAEPTVAALSAMEKLDAHGRSVALQAGQIRHRHSRRAGGRRR